LLPWSPPPIRKWCTKRGTETVEGARRAKLSDKENEIATAKNVTIVYVPSGSAETTNSTNATQNEVHPEFVMGDAELRGKEICVPAVMRMW
jgi:hypothetical protein